VVAPPVEDGTHAFGAPGVAPTWSSSDKDFVTTALRTSRVWATVGHGILNEVYWPSTGRPQLRDLGFHLLRPGRWVDLKRERRYRLTTPAPFVPLLTVEHEGDDYRLALEVLPDPARDVVLVRYALDGAYRLVALAAPHLGGSGADNTAWIGGEELYAQRGSAALCLAADRPLHHPSAGFVGASDGWQDLARHGEPTYAFARAERGNVALTAELPGPHGVLALGFAATPHGARTLVRASLAEGFDGARAAFTADWTAWGERLTLPRADRELAREALLSATVIKAHEDRAYPGALVASLSVPWGNSTDTLGGYHLVWPRDATLAAFALLAADQRADARRVLAHLVAAQLPDGRWPQNYFPNGEPFWTGVQLDEAAFPILLAAKLRELGEAELSGTRGMVRRAAGFVARTGPSSDQDRWEENPGISPFTIAVAIAALVTAAPWLEPRERDYALDLADDWNERLEGWCYVTGTPLAREAGVAGYYVRLAPSGKDGGLTGRVLLRNRAGETIPASALVSLDFSYLVRLGLRRADDRRVRDTLAVADRVLRVETPSGSLYHRYNDDGYGEHADGGPFDGNGVGRAWPLLTGERGHLALQAGEDPLPYLEAMRRCAGPGGLLPEQVWDAAPLPALGLAPGRPSGSAMPLLWSHAEFLKLLVAREAGRPVELLRAVEERYHAAPPAARAWRWRDEVPVARLEGGRDLLVEDRGPFTLHLGRDGWRRVEDREAEPLPFGMWGVRLPAAELEGAAELNFTRRYGRGWEGRDHRVALGEAAVRHALAHVG
jgi:glucoamylase